jgi:hypothetical protein
MREVGSGPRGRFFFQVGVVGSQVPVGSQKGAPPWPRVHQLEEQYHAMAQTGCTRFTIQTHGHDQGRFTCFSLVTKEFPSQSIGDCLSPSPAYTHHIHAHVDVKGKTPAI